MKSDNLREVSLNSWDLLTTILLLEAIKKEKYPEDWCFIGQQYNTIIRDLKQMRDKQK